MGSIELPIFVVHKNKIKMIHLEVKYKGVLSNPNSSYYKRFNGILTKIATISNMDDLKRMPNYDKIISIKEL